MIKPTQGQRGGALGGANALRNDLKDKDRLRREQQDGMASIGNVRLRNDLLPKLDLVYLCPHDLIAPRRNVRQASAAHTGAVMAGITRHGFVEPVLIDGNNTIINGSTRVEAAKQLKLDKIPCVRAQSLTDTEVRVLRLALNRLGEKGHWSLPDLKQELIELVELDVEIEETAFTLAEFDQIILSDDGPLDGASEQGPLTPDPEMLPVAQPGDLFILGNGHKLYCGDATDPAAYQALMGGEQVRLLLTDEPYNVPVSGHVTKGAHREFLMAAGEMSGEEYLAFNVKWMTEAIKHLRDGGLMGTFIDWRGYPAVHAAAVQCGAQPVNLVVWAKTNAGMGSLYRSQHELFPLFKKGPGVHVNNIKFGQNGRWRSNVWTYAGASSVRSDSRKGLEVHPTVKPSAMLADVILDLTHRGRDCARSLFRIRLDSDRRGGNWPALFRH